VISKNIYKRKDSKRWICPFEEKCPGYWCDKCIEIIKQIKKERVDIDRSR